MYKNIDKEVILNLVDEVSYQKHQVSSRNIAASKGLNMTLFAFDKGEELTPHTSTGDAFLMVLDGKAKITINGKENILVGGNSIIMPANIVHAVYALEQFKMLLIISFGNR